MERSLKAKFLWFLVLTLIALNPWPASAQTQQSLPDAPSATRPSSFPKTGPATSSPPASQQQTESSSTSTSQPNQQSQENQSTPPPAQPQPPPPTQEQTPTTQAGDQKPYTLPPVVVNQVIVPVTVKDQSGKLVQGLLKNDFAVYEDGVRQNLNFFTSDPFPMAVAVVIDMGMS